MEHILAFLFGTIWMIVITAQTEQRQDPDTFNRKRMPSHCDRIIYHQSPEDTHPYIQPLKYGSFGDAVVDISDHDPVYSFFQFDELKVLAFSWNIGDFHGAHQEKWNVLAQSLFSQFAEQPTPQFDLIVIALQELNSNFDPSLVINAMKEASPNDLSQFVHRQQIEGYWGKFYTCLIVLYNPITVDVGKLFEYSAKLNVLNTKSFEMIGGFRRVSDPLSSKYITFANAHFEIEPNNPKSEYGLAKREANMEQVYEAYKQNIDLNIIGQTESAADVSVNVLLLLGDLNFRNVMPPKQWTAIDQLTKYIADHPGWNEIGDPNDFAATCKKKPGKWTQKHGTRQSDGKRQSDGWVLVDSELDGTDAIIHLDDTNSRAISSGGASARRLIAKND